MKEKKRTLVAVMGILIAAVLLVALVYLLPLLLPLLVGKRSSGPLHCWVKVVDQDGKGVAGWKCRVIEDQVPFWPFGRAESILRICRTDANGMLEYKSIRSASGAFFGYNAPPQWRLEPLRLVETHYLGVIAAEFWRGVQKDPVNFVGSRSNPYLIHVFVVGPPRKLLFWKKRVDLTRMGNYACIDVLSGRVWESTKPEGDIAMADGAGTYEHPAQCSILVKTGPNCALYPVIDDWGLGPPEDGYLKELCWGKDWQERRRWTYNALQFYYRLDGIDRAHPFYGRLSLGLSSYVMHAEISSFTNLQGERNLFYDGYTDIDRNQEIRDFISPPVQ